MKILIDLVKENKKKLIIGVSSVSLVVISFGFYATSVSAEKIVPVKTITKTKLMEDDIAVNNAFQEKINNTLALIDKRLLLVQQQIENTSFKNQDNTANYAVKDLSNTVISLKEEVKTSFVQSHEENEVLAKKLHALQEVISALKADDKKIQYFDKKELPFEVVAIDSVNEEPVLALKYNYNHISLEKGEKIAGWKVINLDYAKQLVEFDDEKGAHVRFSLADEQKERSSWA